MGDDQVRGMGDAMKQAAAGLKLFKEDDVVEGDLEAATKFKGEIEAKMAALEEESKALTGKENKKLRTEKDKEKAGLKVQKDYIDACKVVKGLEPINGFFIKKGSEKKTEEPAAAAPVAAEPEKKDEKAKKDKPKKEMESTGISRDERAELEKLKENIISKKTELKGEGMTGGQINKHEDIVKMVTRMNELKEKECPGSSASKKDEAKGKKKQLSGEANKQYEEKERAFEEYTEKLRTEFKYTKKEIAADPEYQEMKAELDKMKK